MGIIEINKDDFLIIRLILFDIKKRVIICCNTNMYLYNIHETMSYAVQL